MSHKAVAGWLAALERLYAIFRLPPLGAPRIRAVKKEQKLKWVHFQQDSLGLDFELRYFRDTDGREVDFVVVERPLRGGSSSASGATPRPIAGDAT